MLPVIFGHVPAGASTKQFGHYAQEFNSGHFRQFDYGEYENLIRYRISEPPDYNIKNIKAPIAFYYSENDWLAAKDDVEKLLKQLSNIVAETYIPRYNHLDYVWGINAPQEIYKDVLRRMRKIDLTNLFQNLKPKNQIP